MSETVFILGAGASMHAGAPCMGDFLDVADRLRRTKQVPDGAVGTAFDQVLAGRAALDPVFAKASIDADNLESVFGAFEMAQLFGQFGSLTPDVISALPNAMRTVIVETLDLTIKYPHSSAEHSAPSPPLVYDRFAHLIEKMLDQDQTVSVITFNYDVAFDYAVYGRSLQIDYCLTPPPPRHGQRDIDLMKLHGSVNWTTCPRCDEVVAYRFEQYLRERTWRGHAAANVPINFREPLTKYEHCKGVTGDGLAVIVPPTWNKAAGHHEIGTVWQRAVKHLSEARNIVVIGYSLPPSDEFFRYLYALGTVSATRLERFVLVNPDKDAGERFRDLLGRGVQHRFRPQQSHFESDIIGWLTQDFLAK
jgi:NAD-dependent SIR2 family protein deacetylase